MKRHSNGKGGPADYDGSTPLTDARRETYVQHILSGRYASRMDAYEAAGYKRQNGNETRLLQKPEVKTRLRWLQAQVQERTITTAEDIARQLDEDRKLAHKLKQASAAVSASMGKAKVLGLIVEKQEHTGKDGGPIRTEDVSELTPVERAQRLAAILVAGGTG